MNPTSDMAANNDDDDDDDEEEEDDPVPVNTSYIKDGRPVKKQRSPQDQGGETEQDKGLASPPASPASAAGGAVISTTAAAGSDGGDGNRAGRKSSLLHLACCRPGVTVDEVRDILSRDPGAASRPVSLETYRMVYNPVRRVRVKKAVTSYRYPLNLAIKYGASGDVLGVLVDAAPSVILHKDGAMEETSLSVLIRYSPADVETVYRILTALGEECASRLPRADRHHNTCVHVAATRPGVSVEVLRHLVGAFPETLLAENFHGKSPLDLAREQTVNCSDRVVTYLLIKTTEQLESSAR